MKIFNLKSKLAIYTVTVILLLVVVSCSKDDNPTNPTSNNDPFTFLKVGNELEYGLYYYDTDELRQTMKLTIVSENNGYFKVIQDDDYTLPTYWFTDNDGWYKNDTESKVGAVLIIPQNCYVGLKYKSPDFPDSLAEIVSVSEKVVVPAGTFSNCIKFKEYFPDDPPDDTYIMYHYYHKDIGMIMIDAGKGILKLHSKNF
jgi:hypothetical protein